MNILEDQPRRDVEEKDLQYIVDSLRAELSQMSGSNLLLTGGAGFLGYYLTKTILHFNRAAAPADRIKLTVWDNFIRGVPGWLSSMEGEGVRIERRDATQPMAPDAPAYHFMIHAASIASPTYYRLHPIETMDTNVMGIRWLLEYAKGRSKSSEPVKGLLFFSSSEVYGDPSPDRIPTAEDYNGNVSFTGPRACYDESKRYGETLCVNFARQHEVPVKIARPFNNYGPGLKTTDRRVIPDFVRDILAGRDIIMLSDGSPTRTFCYVADAVVGYYKILTRGRAGESYNIGVETPEISMAGLAEKLVTISRDVTGYKGNVVRQASTDREYLVDNPNRRCPVLAKARHELGYDPKITLDEGLRRSVVWYRYNRAAEEAA